MTAAALEAYWEAVGAGDEEAAWAVASAARDQGLDLLGVITHLVLPVQVRVGEQWAANRWSVAREHLATAISEDVVRRLGDAVPEPPAGRGPLLVTCAEREWHALAAQVVTQILRSLGYPAVSLGAHPSATAVVGEIVERGPRAVLVSASLGSSLPWVRRLVEAVRETGTPVVVGGRAFDVAGLRAAGVGATAYAGDPADLPEVLASLPHHVESAAPLHGPRVAESDLVVSTSDALVRQLRGDLDAALGRGPRRRTGSGSDWRVVLHTSVPHVVGTLAAALLVDDPSMVTENAGWLRGVLVQHGGPASALDVLWDSLAARLRDFPEALGLLESSRVLTA